MIVNITATQALTRITRFLGYLSEMNPAGVNSRINGNRIRALTMAVRTIWVWPS